MVGMGDPLSKISLEVPQILDTKSYPSTSYNRTVYWEFEDIQMLLGMQFENIRDIFAFWRYVDVFRFAVCGYAN